MDKMRTPFNNPSGRTKTPKKEGFKFSFVKSLPEAVTVPLPPDPEEDAEISENVFKKRPSCEQEGLEKEVFREEDKQAAEQTLYNQYEEKIRPCIDLVDSLRALGVEKDLSLPAIAVIGDQSSGKSSVLEALSGVALPRGNGIVTRCPLELKLKRLPEGQAWQGKISYQNVTLELQNASEVDRAIRQAQDVVAGPRGAISGQLISLEVRSPDVPDLTLIDLPGIARVAVGDQPKDIGDQIKVLLKRTIGCKETVNLVVVPCNVDIATTEALKMAQEVDPTGERTIGILTKPDLVDRGTEEAIVNILQNRVIPLKKGYMIVRCRGQQDIHNKLTLAAAIQQERSFFENHKYFRALLEEGKATIPCLAEKLTNELVKHIIKSLPALQSQIRDTLHKTLQDLQRYKRGTPQTESEKLFFLTDLIKLFNQDICRTIRGEEELFGDEVRLFTKIRKEFRTWGVILLECAARAKKAVPDRVWKYEDRYRGREFPGFSNYGTFEDIVKEQIRELEEPAILILNNVMKLVEEKFMELTNKNFANFHNLSRVAKVKIEDIRENQAAEAERQIRTQFKMERIVYCQDDLYIGDLNSLKAENAPNSSLEKKLQFVGLEEPSVATEMVSHTSAYFSGATKRLSNQIPLIIISSVLHDFGENVQTSMLQLLQDKERLNFLLDEDTEAAKTRNYLSQRIDRLTTACQYLRDFRLL
ncbi:interferon-induced GTP-binding protein Mx-like isoform X1 [Parus major]|uniref:interferon-induced GTP-binding protein Mx-like isoform X1 n=1 Tax=Parus major TaxID=9157 RepID=UPI0007711BFF|nr:interferon-induced GTP-binding protein Mx-like isoform X1 [Parus major]XP_015490227.1 interferon-induced GTP-binding protein Mx-like isoform X1 [Parus major]XP_015490237.1 interferon-induced GTP-binding protein Mx-like isoform X1 [Parus major]XP_015490247.1 interferon-induced GTP-binding protein Mx-like isoform X1 [Parus major]